MDIQTKKLELLKTILENENPEFIQKVSEFVKQEQFDLQEELSLAQRKEIKEGIEQLGKGRRVPYGEFLKKISR